MGLQGPCRVAACGKTLPVVATASNALQGLFEELYLFGDSLTDYGSFAAYQQKVVLAPTAQPPWSGVSFSNDNTVSQLDLRTILGLMTPSQSPPSGLAIPTPLYQLANAYVAIPGLGSEVAPSYSIGGATSSSVSLYDVITVPGTAIPLSTAFPKLASTGVQNQIRAALKQGVRPASNQLTLTQGGANNLLIAYIQKNPDIEGVLNQVMANMRQNLSVQLRAMGSRQLMTFALAPFRGVVDGVAYQMPFLSGLLQQASQPVAPAWLQSWQTFVDAGGLETFQQNYAAMVQGLAQHFPYAALISYNPEFGANWNAYGERLGNFARYGIANTLAYAQATNQPLTTAQTDQFLYFDTIHNTASGQAMTAQAMGLTLEANQDRIKAARLIDSTVGRACSDRLVASRRNCELLGLGGADWLFGRSGNDVLDGGADDDRLLAGHGNDYIAGGQGSDHMSGGDGADFFAYQGTDAQGRWRDRITDFKGGKGDRLGITAVLDGTDPFANQGWTYIGSERFTGVSGQLRFADGWLRGDVDGDGRAELLVQLAGVSTFSMDWVS